MASRTRKPKPRVDQIQALFIAAEYFEDRGEVYLAATCLKQAAEHGHESSQLNLGNYYSWGTGVSRDPKKAAYWYKRAYNNQSRGFRDSAAAVNLAIDLRAAGKTRQAVQWFERARALGDGSASLELAKHYLQHGAKVRAAKLAREVLALDGSETSELEREEAAELLAKIVAKK
jgi:TPR repeat protein